MKKRILPVLLAASLLICPGCAMGEVEQTNESLTVAYYGTDIGANGDLLNAAVSSYSRQYPNVKLIIQRQPTALDSQGEEQYFLQLASSIMAGKGPDLILLDWTADLDLPKMVKAGAFADLSPYFRSDPQFDMEQYAAPVLEAGVFEEGQCLIPLTYSVPVAVGEQGLMEKSGLDLSGCTTALEQWRTLAEYSRRCGEDPELPKPFRQAYMLRYVQRHLGLELVDYQSGTVSLSAPELEEWCGYFKEVYQTDPEPIASGADYGGAIESYAGRSLLDDCLRGGYAWVAHDLEGIASFGEGVVVPLYSLNGEVSAEVCQVCAVSRSSPNQENAANFIKALISPEVQESVWQWTLKDGIPVNWEAFEASLAFYQKERPDDRIYTAVTGIPAVCPIPEAQARQYADLVRSVTFAVLPSPADGYLTRELQPYWEGEIPFEEAIRNAEEKLGLYISE